jgi:hypothetical protein
VPTGRGGGQPRRGGVGLQFEPSGEPDGGLASGHALERSIHADVLRAGCRRPPRGHERLRPRAERRVARSSRGSTCSSNALDADGVVPGDRITAHADALVVSPGSAGPTTFAAACRSCPGAAFAIGVGPSRGRDAIFLYLSLEHPFRTTAQ